MRRWLTAIGYVSQVIGAMPQGDFDFSNEVHIAHFASTLLGDQATQDAVIGFAALATDQPVELFDRIDLDEGIKIVLAVIEVNKDFFVQRVLPMIYEVAPQVKGVITETFGQTV
jgi:hypothetical protein